MTIYLPEDPALFRRAFNDTCDRILSCKQNQAFYALFAELAAYLREHSLLKEYIKELEIASEKEKQAFNCIALDALEDNWRRLWKYHRHRLKHRKQLVRIKRMITTPAEISYSPLYNRALFSMWEFRYYSPFCRSITEAGKIYRETLSLPFGCVLSDHFSTQKEQVTVIKKVARDKLSKKHKFRNLYTLIFRPGLQVTSPAKHSAEHLPSALFSSKIQEIEQKYLIPGRNNDEKRMNMRIIAETSPSFCWERICLLEKCHTGSGSSLPPFKASPGRWNMIRHNAWRSATQRCDVEALLGARMSLAQKLSPKNNSCIDSFLICEYQIHRNDYEHYLSSLKNHIHTQLFKIESAQHVASNHPDLVLPGTQKENFVIDHAPKYWKKHPSAKRDEVFQDYCSKCPSSKKLSRYRWEQIVRDRKLDPRPKEAKKRGLSKKTLQN